MDEKCGGIYAKSDEWKGGGWVEKDDRMRINR